MIFESRVCLQVSLYFVVFYLVNFCHLIVESMQHQDPISGEQKVGLFRIDYSKSTEDNFATNENPLPPIVGKYNFLRNLLDYSYHKHYSEDRQKLHDFLIDEGSGETVIYDSTKNLVCEKPAGGNNWIVFTAGKLTVN